MKKIFTLIGLVVFGFSARSQYFNFNTPSPTTTFPGILVDSMDVGNSNGAVPAIRTTTSASSGYTGSSGTFNLGVAAATGGLTTANSAFFTITLNTQAVVNVQNLIAGFTFGTRSTGTGPQAFAVRSSIDNFASDLTTGTITNNSQWTLKTVSFTTPIPITFAGITFRIYGYNGAGTPGAGTANWRIDDFNMTYGGLLLPSTLSNLTALVQNGRTRISFEASNEVNVAHYSIEKSSDNRSFNEVAKLEARGGGLYSYNDVAPTAATYYRIRTNDKDGRSQLSNVVLVNAGKSLSLKVLPNPASDVAVVNFPELKAAASLSLVDMNGRRLQIRSLAAGTSQVSLNVADLTKGNYLIQLTSEGETTSVMVVK